MSEHVVLMKGVRNVWNLHGILQALGGCLLGVIIINKQCIIWYNSSKGLFTVVEIVLRTEETRDIDEVPLRGNLKLLPACFYSVNLC